MMHKDSIHSMCKDCITIMELMNLTQETVMMLGTLGTLMLYSRTIEQMNLTQETVMTLGRLMLDSV
jgi:hypothetical protein